jgi:hypothetical protein
VFGAAILAIMVVGGCGGGDSGESSQYISKAEFIKQAGAACREQRADLKQRAARYLSAHRTDAPSEKLDGFVRFILLPTIEAETTRVRHVPHPPLEDTEISAALSATELAVRKVVTRRMIPSLEAVYASFGESEAQFRALGLTVCANGPHFQRYNSIY